MGFKEVKIDKIPKTKDPETYFLNLRRDQEIKHLWSHQADLLRKYSEMHIKTKDISFELPTGTGKTLVGLLIGAWRMEVFQERILYLCPTRQLAFQVQEHAKKYGIKAYTFVSSQKNYPSREFSLYNSNELIAISTYSGLFNTNPRLNNADVIICDDAHAADNYISSLWSLNIRRFENESLYQKLIDLFEDDLPFEIIECVKSNSIISFINDQTEMIHLSKLYRKKEHLIEIINSELIKAENKNLTYSWSLIYPNLLSCNFFISWYEILIRPWCPPSLTHPPFKRAKQRIYMSATLGYGGELERITGIPKIERLPVPKGWERKGSGRRFFLFPDFNFKTSEYIDWLLGKIEERDRSLILCPDYLQYISIENLIKSSLKNLEIFTANDIEDSLESFTENNKAVLILTNRYDGIDLPDEKCRQLIIYGLPEAVNLQEKFLLQRLNVYSILKDRILTRFTQACGRCTRGPTDYSLILLVGEKIRDFCLKRENRLSMHPELQAEIEFGRIQSEVSKLNEFNTLIDLFFKQGSDWQIAEKNIQKLRDNIENYEDTYFDKLKSIVSHEINFQYALWSKDYNNALNIAREISDKLNGEEFEGYRALWYYFSGSIGLILYSLKNEKEYLNIAKDFYNRAINCSKIISWFSEIPTLLQDQIADIEIDDLTSYSIENIQKTIKKLGGVGGRFETELSNIERLINNDQSAKFEAGLKKLGALLGFVTNRPLGDGVPDSVWYLSDKLLLLFEAKNEEKAEGGISKATCLQASGHNNWAKSKFKNYDRYKEIFCILIGNKSEIEDSAGPHIKNIIYLKTERVREIFKHISGILRRIRAHSIQFDEDTIRLKIYGELDKYKLKPIDLIYELKRNELSNLL